MGRQGVPLSFPPGSSLLKPDMAEKKEAEICMEVGLYAASDAVGGGRVRQERRGWRGNSDDRQLKAEEVKIGATNKICDLYRRCAP